MGIRSCAFAVVLVLGCSSSRPAADGGTRVSRVEAPPGPAVASDVPQATAPTAATQAPATAKPEPPVPPPAPLAPRPNGAPKTAAEAARAMWESHHAAVEAGSGAVRQRIAAEPGFKKALTATLEARGFEPFFTTSTGPTAALDVLVAAVKDLPDHGVKTEPYAPDALTAAIEKLKLAANGVGPARADLEADPAWEPLRPLVERRDAPTGAEVRAWWPRAAWPPATPTRGRNWTRRTAAPWRPAARWMGPAATSR